MKIYTKAGDDGTTGLFGGSGIAKDDPRVEAYGTVDELAAAVGLARASELPRDLDDDLHALLTLLFRLGAELACTPGREAKLGVPLVDERDVAWLEGRIDAHQAELPLLREFVLPGGTRAAAALHLARTVCRRAERRVVSAGRGQALSAKLVVTLNRLGDLLFVLARRANHLGGAGDVPWNLSGGAVG